MSLFGAFRRRSTESARPRRMPALPCLSRTLKTVQAKQQGVVCKVSKPSLVSEQARRSGRVVVTADIGVNVPADNDDADTDAEATRMGAGSSRSLSRNIFDGRPIVPVDLCGPWLLAFKARVGSTYWFSPTS